MELEDEFRRLRRGAPDDERQGERAERGADEMPAIEHWSFLQSMPVSRALSLLRFRVGVFLPDPIASDSFVFFFACIRPAVTPAAWT